MQKGQGQGQGQGQEYEPNAYSLNPNAYRLTLTLPLTLTLTPIAFLSFSSIQPSIPHSALDPVLSPRHARALHFTGNLSTSTWGGVLLSGICSITPRLPLGSP